MTDTWWCEHAWLGGDSVTDGVLFGVSDGRITTIETDTTAQPGSHRLRGLIIPGLANAHSHAFHRALRSRTQGDRGSFWTWRDLMYRAAERLNPDRYRRLARAVYAEMALAGITAVGEFHYVHHDSGGSHYADPNAMGHAVIDGAADAGIRLTLLDTCYLSSAPDGSPLTGPQLRFGDETGDRWAQRVEALRQQVGAQPAVLVGAALHSVRGVPVEHMPAVVEWAAAHSAPLHVHSSEQIREVEQCLAVHGRTPTAVLRDVGALGPLSTAVHATHLTAEDIADLDRTATGVCFCPTTERDLGDGIGPAPALLAGRGLFSLGSDSHAVIDLFEEARAVELNERLASRVRGVIAADRLLRAATYDGHHSLGWRDAGEFVVGARADFVAVQMDSIRTAGGGAGIENVVFAAAAPDVTDVVVDGRAVVVERKHVTVPNVETELASAIADLMDATMTVLYTDIGELVTNDPTHGDGDPLGIIADAALVVDGSAIVWVGRRSDAPGADDRVSCADTSVIPGFVDSHSHMVFAGERSAEFAARMSGQPYGAGGIASTVAATRAADDATLLAGVQRLADELVRAGVTTFECKSGYGLTVDDEARSLRIAGAVTDETTFLGAHVVPAEFRDDRAAYVDLVAGPMLQACSPHARWIDVFCDRGAFDVDEARHILSSGMAAGLTPRLHAGQLGPSGGIRLAVELGAASVDHCTYATDDDVEALAGAADTTVATLLPGAEFSTRAQYPDAKRLIDAGATVALATDCNPGSSFTTSMPFCIAVAVRDMNFTPAQALWAATAGGAAALRRSDIGVIAVGRRADFVRLDAPSYLHLAYRPGVPLVRDVVKAGQHLPHSYNNVESRS